MFVFVFIFVLVCVLVFVFVYFVVEDIPPLPLLHDPFSCPQPHVSIPSIPGGGAPSTTITLHFTSLENQSHQSRRKRRKRKRRRRKKEKNKREKGRIGEDRRA